LAAPLDILLVDEDAVVLGTTAAALADAGHRVVVANDGKEGLAQLNRRLFDVAILDLSGASTDGLRLFRHARRSAPSTAVVLLTSFGRVEEAVALLKEGAHDYVAKPFDCEAFVLDIIGRLADRRAISRELDEARAQLGELGDDAGAIIGRSAAIRALLQRVDVTAQSDAPILICGESGTGKELVARTLHQRSRRRAGPFVAVNCAAFPETLLEAELFGHERGAFTGAVKKRDGRFKHAHGGTLLLDEIAELPPPAQAKLLRVLAEGTIEPLGSDKSVPVDVRVLSATHQDLKRRISDGRFRQDLYYRLNVIDLVIPPLRHRPGDLPILLEYFLRKFAAPGQPRPSLSPAAWHALCDYEYPGNVRELAHAIEGAVVLAQGSEIDVAHLPPDIRASPSVARAASGVEPLASAVREFERQHIMRALAAAGGKRTRAAELLGISRKTLWEKLRAFGVDEREDDASGQIDLKVDRPPP
jgi:DNA-binding NtrC family response regulator